LRRSRSTWRGRAVKADAVGLEHEALRAPEEVDLRRDARSAHQPYVDLRPRDGGAIEQAQRAFLE
jgi:hypothetical protein